MGRRPFGYFWAFPKVTRCKSGTISSRYRSNGYVLNHGLPGVGVGGGEQAVEFVVAYLFELGRAELAVDFADGPARG